MRFTPAITTRLVDDAAERVRRNHEQQITEIQSREILDARVIHGVVLGSGGPPVTVAHGLGRPPKVVSISAIRWVDGTAISAGSVLDYGAQVAGVPIDRSRNVVLLGIGFGVAVTVDVTVY